MALSKEELNAATTQLNAAVEAFNSSSDDANRQSIVSAAERLLLCARDPNTMWMEDAITMTRLGTIHLFQTWGAFALIPKDSPISIPDLASQLSADLSLVERTVGVLTSLSILTFQPPNLVSHTPRSLTLLPSNPLCDLYHIMWDNAMVPFFHLPAYFSAYGRKEPQSTNHIPATFARACPEKAFYEYLASDPEYFRRFTAGMAVVESHVPASGMYDFSKVIEESKKEGNEGRVVLVDVGGGKGQALVAFKEEFPGLEMGRCVLEDRKEVLEGKGLEGLEGVRREVVDFHEGQPVKGAMVYFMRRCLHNYSDELATNILRILVEAMAEDSKILIQEDVQSVPPSAAEAFLDILMMAYGGKQRSLQCWEKVVQGAGLRISGMFKRPGSTEALSVIECVKEAL
ncbi:O-methyltransferase [Podospora aff. communis PSN243]|uniref:O-methyltransferase n=1 Tax=Podospora aff. communis PSN243 TaxID=3040156 RepID=A0AAV9H300_9PEZI|nr:O-methyltransferase [Podospora aff. communis PSN243]